MSSSSNIIKTSSASADDLLQSFCFQSISKGTVLVRDRQQPVPSFKPLDLFDCSGMTEHGEQQHANSFKPLDLFNAYAADQPDEIEQNQESNEEEIQEPLGVTLSQEELDASLAQSYENGLQEGKNLAERGLLNVVKTLRSATDGVHELREKVLRESEDEILKLIIMVARKIIVKEISLDRSILSEVLKNALVGISDRDEVTIYINPNDYVMATNGRDEIIRKELIGDRMALKPDPSVLSGCCKIDTEMGKIDAGIDDQLDEIYRHLLEERTMSAVTAA